MEIKTISEIENKFFISMSRQILKIFKFQRHSDNELLSIVIDPGEFAKHKNVLQQMPIAYKYKDLYANNTFLTDDVAIYFYDTAMYYLIHNLLKNIDSDKFNTINSFLYNEKLIITGYKDSIILSNQQNGFTGIYNRPKTIDNIIEYMFALNGFDNLKVNFKNTQWKE